MPLTKVQTGLIEATGTPSSTTFLRGDGAWATPASGGITSGTAVSASGTSVDFTGIPSTAKRITVMFSGLSVSGTSSYLVQIGDSGGIENTGYTSSGFIIATVGSTGANSTAGYIMCTDTAAYLLSGMLVITNITSNTWVASYTFGSGTNLTGLTGMGGGSKALSPGPLDRVRITTVNGTDTFDAGTINILYES